MINWTKHLTSLGKAVVIALIAAGLIAAIVVAYSLMGPQAAENLTNP